MSDTGTPRPPWGLGKSLTLAAVVVFGLVVVLMLTVDTTPPASATEAVTEAEPEPVTGAEPEPDTEAEPETDTEAEPEPVTGAEPEPDTEAEPEPVTGAAAAPVAEQVAAVESTPAAAETAPAEPEPEELSAVTLEVLALFAELYAFKDDPTFHSVGFGVGGPYSPWMGKQKSIAEKEGLVPIQQIGYLSGDVWFLAMEYMGHAGATKGYMREMEKDLLAHLESQGLSIPEPMQLSEEQAARVAEYERKKAEFLVATAEAADQQEWYQGGTLHKANASEWRKGSDEDRLATAADWAATLIEEKLTSIDDLKPYAENLLTCADEAIADTQIEIPMTQIAAVCWTLLGGEG